jgi:hypothetical protein
LASSEAGETCRLFVKRNPAGVSQTTPYLCSFVT